MPLDQSQITWDDDIQPLDTGNIKWDDEEIQPQPSIPIKKVDFSPEAKKQAEMKSEAFEQGEIGLPDFSKMYERATPEEQKQIRTRQSQALKAESEWSPNRISQGIGRVYKVAKQATGAGMKASGALVQKAADIKKMADDLVAERGNKAPLGTYDIIGHIANIGITSEDIEKAAQFVYKQGEAWYDEAKKRDPDELDDFISTSIGSAVPGMAAWMADIPWATLEGAAEAHKEGKSEAWGATVGGLKRFVLGRIFHFLGQYPKGLQIPGMGAVFGAQAKLEGADPIEAAKAAIEGLAIGTLPGGKKKGKEKEIPGEIREGNILPDEVVPKPKEEGIFIESEAGARAAIIPTEEGKVAEIADIAAGIKGEGFTEKTLKDLSNNEFETVHIPQQSADMQATLTRLVEKGVLTNPREPYDIESYGVSPEGTSDFPTRFDINKKYFQEIPDFIPPEYLKPEMPSVETIEAGVKGGATGELPKYAEGSAINLERIEGTQDFKQFLNQMTQASAEKIGKRTITVPEIRDRAEAMGMTPKEAKRLARSRQFYSSDMAVVEQIHRNVAQEMFDTIRDMPADPAQRTPEMLAKIAEQTEFYTDILAATSTMKSEWGRAGVMQRQMKQYEKGFGEEAAKMKVIDQLIRKYGGEENINAVIDALKDIDPTDMAAMNRIIRELSKPTAWDHIKRIMYDAYLSLPTTHEANIIGNTLRFMWKFPEKAIWSGYEIVRGMIPGKKKAVYLREIKPDIIGSLHGLKKGFTQAWQTVKSGEGMTDQTKLADIGKGARAKLPGFAENIRPTTLLQAMDEFFSGLIYESELTTLAYRKATALGVKGKIKAKKIAEFMQDENLKAKAWQQALELTWRQEMGPLGKKFLQLRNVKIPGTEVQPLVPFIPFIQTGANIARFTFEALPIHLPVTAMKAATGRIKGEQVTLELARTTLGTATAGIAFMLASNGMITGGGPKDRAERDKLYRTGWLPYAITPKFAKMLGLGEQYIQISRYEPFSSIFGIAADLQEGIKNKTEDEKFNLITAMIDSASKNIMSKTWWMGVTNIINAASDPEGYSERFIENFVRTPIPAISRGVARSFDPYYRDPQNLWDAIKVGIPTLSTTVLPKINVWGEPIKRVGTPTTRLVSPSQVSEPIDSPIDKEMIRLGINIGMMSRKLTLSDYDVSRIKEADYKITRDVARPGRAQVELTPREYAKMMAIFGQKTKPLLNQIIQSSTWETFDDATKIKVIRGVVDDGRRMAKYVTMENIKRGNK